MTTLSQSMDARGQRQAANSQTAIREPGAKTAEVRDRDLDRKLLRNLDISRRRRSVNTMQMTSSGERQCHTRTLSQPPLTHSLEGNKSTQTIYAKSNKTHIF